MLLHAFIPASRANGPGLRTVIYFQGCSLNCAGCWNPNSHKFRGADVETASVVAQAEAGLRSSAIAGVTFSGGEPMQQAQDLVELVRGIRAVAPRLSFGMFTGYCEAELAAGEYVTRYRATTAEKRRLWNIIRDHLDFAIMGRYNRTQPGTEPLRTSKNQRLVLFSSRHMEEDFNEQVVEVSIDTAGNAIVTGFPVLGCPAA